MTLLHSGYQVQAMASHATKGIEKADLVGDERAFDVRVVESVLEYINALRDETSTEIEAQKSFAWIPNVLRQRAALFGIDEKLSKFVVLSAADASHSKALVAWGFVEASLYRSPGGFKSSPQLDWVNGVLSTLQICQRYRIKHGRVEKVSVPMISTPYRCVAYAIAAIIEDRHYIGKRVRLCPYTKKGEAQHLFLDYRLDDEGKLLRGQPQEFCCPKHAGAYRQRQYREKQEESKS
jgi:hypothetical protein